MVEHSERYLERRASIGQTKPMHEHIAHVKKRFLERFDITISTRDYYDIVERIHKDGGRPLYKINGSNNIIELEIQGKMVWVLYGCKSDRQPSRLKTVLVPYTGYLVPDSLSDHYDHRTFTIAMNEAMDYFMELSKQLDIKDPANKKAFFTQPNVHPTALSGAYFYVKSNHDKGVMIRVASRYLKHLKNISEEED